MALQEVKALQALILCAGFGTRMLPITNYVPKALISYRGARMLDRIVAQLKRAGIQKIAINSHYLADVLHTYVKKHYPEITILHEEEILLTGGSVKHAMTAFNIDELLVVNCDAYFDCDDPFSAFLSAWNGNEDMYLMCARALDNRKGDFLVSQSQAFIQDGITNTHIWTSPYIIAKRLFSNTQDKFPLQELILPIIRQEKHNIYIFESLCNWSDVGHFSCLSESDRKQSLVFA